MTCSMWVIIKAQWLRNSMTKKPKKVQWHQLIINVWVLASQLESINVWTTAK